MDETKVVRIDVELVLGNSFSFLLSSLVVSIFSLFTVELFSGVLYSGNLVLIQPLFPPFGLH